MKMKSVFSFCFFTADNAKDNQRPYPKTGKKEFKCFFINGYLFRFYQKNLV